MENELISTEIVCTHYEVDNTFLQSLGEAGLVELTWQSERPYINQAQLHELERMIRLHYDLHINLEGLEAVTHLVDRVKLLQQEVARLHNRLTLYEENNPS